MKRKAKALVSEYKNELLAARTLYVSLDRADNVIDGGAPFCTARLTMPVRVLDVTRKWMMPLRQLTAKSVGFGACRWGGTWGPAFSPVDGVRLPRGCAAVAQPIRNRLQRRYGHQHLHFITCSCYRRRCGHETGVYIKIEMPAAKAACYLLRFFARAEARAPPHECGGSHGGAELFIGELRSRVATAWG